VATNRAPDRSGHDLRLLRGARDLRLQRPDRPGVAQPNRLPQLDGGATGGIVRSAAPPREDALDRIQLRAGSDADRLRRCAALFAEPLDEADLGVRIRNAGDPPAWAALGGNRPVQLPRVRPPVGAP